MKKKSFVLIVLYLNLSLNYLKRCAANETYRNLNGQNMGTKISFVSFKDFENTKKPSINKLSYDNQFVKPYYQTTPRYEVANSRNKISIGKVHNETGDSKNYYKKHDDFYNKIRNITILKQPTTTHKSTFIKHSAPSIRYNSKHNSYEPSAPPSEANFKKTNPTNIGWNINEDSRIFNGDPSINRRPQTLSPTNKKNSIYEPSAPPLEPKINHYEPSAPREPIYRYPYETPNIGSNIKQNGSLIGNGYSTNDHQNGGFKKNTTFHIELTTKAPSIFRVKLTTKKPSTSKTITNFAKESSTTPNLVIQGTNKRTKTPIRIIYFEKEPSTTATPRRVIQSTNKVTTKPIRIIYLAKEPSTTATPKRQNLATTPKWIINFGRKPSTTAQSTKKPPKRIQTTQRYTRAKTSDIRKIAALENYYAASQAYNPQNYKPEWLHNYPKDYHPNQPIAYHPHTNVYYGPASAKTSLPSYSYYTPPDTSLIGEIVKFKTAKMFTHSNSPQFAQRTYNIDYHTSLSPIATTKQIRVNEIVICSENITILCFENSYPLCLSNGTIICIAKRRCTQPCSDNLNIPCLTSIINCNNNIYPICSTIQNTATIKVHCLANIIVYGNLTQICHNCYEHEFQNEYRQGNSYCAVLIVSPAPLNQENLGVVKTLRLPILHEMGWNFFGHFLNHIWGE